MWQAIELQIHHIPGRYVYLTCHVLYSFQQLKYMVNITTVRPSQ